MKNVITLKVNLFHFIHTITKKITLLKHVSCLQLTHLVSVLLHRKTEKEIKFEEDVDFPRPK